jgi:hypothetical protein
MTPLPAAVCAIFPVLQTIDLSPRLDDSYVTRP